MADDLKMMTLREAAAALDVSVTKLRAYVAAGNLKVMHWGNQVRVPRWYLMEWQKQQLDKSTELVNNLTA